MRIVCWFSCGVASAVATKLAIAQYGKENIVIARCVVHEEHQDNQRFADDCAKWFDMPILELVNEKYNGSAPNSGKRDNMLILRNAPVVSITNIKYNVGTQATPSWVTYDADEYTLDTLTGIVHFYSPMPAGIQNISVTYVAGYLIDFANEYDDTLHTLPYEVSDLCERLVTKLLKKRESEGRTQESFSNSTINWGAFLDEHDRMTIANYRRHFMI